MQKNISRLVRNISVFFALWLLILSESAIAGSGKSCRVFQYVVHEATGNVNQIAAGITAAASKNGWIIGASYSAGVPEGCTFQSTVIALIDTAFAAEVLKANPSTGAFAVIDRINIFTDEQGAHVSVVNPCSILRTVLMDDQRYAPLAEAHLKSLRSVILSSVKGTPSEQEYGEERDEGYIGKTMGVIAGGPFREKIQDIGVLNGASCADAANRISASLASPGSKWGLHAAYRITLDGGRIEIIGICGSALDGKSFDIVGAGSDGSRGDYRCPGLAHAGAYPLELVVSTEGNQVHVRMVDAMFRMKMYFEDAGKWAFMKNMSMPGSIKGEITDRLAPIFK